MDGRLSSGAVLKVKRCWEGQASLPKIMVGFSGGISRVDLTPRQRAVKRRLFDDSAPRVSVMPSLPAGEITVGDKLVLGPEGLLSHKRLKLSPPSDHSPISDSDKVSRLRNQDNQASREGTADHVDSESFSTDDEREIDYPSGSDNSDNDETDESSPEDDTGNSSNDDSEDSSGNDSDENSEDEDDDTADDDSDPSSEDEENDAGDDESDPSSEDEYDEIDSDSDESDDGYGPPQRRALAPAPARRQAPPAIRMIPMPDARKRIALDQALRIAYGCVRPAGISPNLHFDVIKNLDDQLHGDDAPEFPTPMEQALAQNYRIETLRAAGEVKLMEAYLKETLKNPAHDLDDIANVNRVPDLYRASAASLPRYI